MKENKERLDQKGCQRRALIKAGGVGIVSAVLAALFPRKTSEIEAKRKRFYKQAETARQVKKAVAEAKKTEQTEQAKELAFFSEHQRKPTPELSTDIAKRQIKELQEKLGSGFEITIEFNPRPQVVSDETGVKIRTFPNLSEETQIGGFSKNDKTPELLAIASINDSEGVRYDWGIFRYQDIERRNIYFENKKPTVSTSDWGEVVFSCLKEGNEVYTTFY